MLQKARLKEKDKAHQENDRQAVKRGMAKALNPRKDNHSIGHRGAKNHRGHPGQGSHPMAKANHRAGTNNIVRPTAVLTARIIMTAAEKDVSDGTTHVDGRETI